MRTIRYCHTLLYGALGQAEKNQVVARNVSKLTELPRGARQEMHTLTLDQVTAKLLPAITQDRLFAAIFLAFCTGLRRGELLALRWKDVDLKKSSVWVQHIRTMALSSAGPMAPELLPRTFERLIVQAGLPPIRFHDARHTFATLRLELGVPPKTVQTLLGHSRVAITLDIYSHVSLELEQKAAAKLNTALTGRG